MIGVKPEGADGAAVHVIGGEIDRAWVRDFARAHEKAGFDRVLVGYTRPRPTASWSPRYAAAHTERLGFLHRAPARLRRADARRAQGRHARPVQRRPASALHIITGGSDAEQQRDGDWLDHDDALPPHRRIPRRRCARVWTGDRARSTTTASSTGSRAPSPRSSRCQQPHMPIYFGGASGGRDRRSARKHADVYALWGEPLAAVARAHRRGARGGRASTAATARFSVSLRPDPRPRPRRRPGSAPTTSWPRSARMRVAAAASPRSAPPQSVGSQRLLDFAAEGEVLDKRLWTPIAAATGAARQHHRAGRHAGAGGRGAARLLRPRRDHVPDPRLRPARGRDRVRPRADPARARRSGPPRSRRHGASVTRFWRSSARDAARPPERGDPSSGRDGGGAARRLGVTAEPGRSHASRSPTAARRRVRPTTPVRDRGARGGRLRAARQPGLSRNLHRRAQESARPGARRRAPRQARGHRRHGRAPHHYLGVDWQLRAVLAWFGAVSRRPASIWSPRTSGMACSPIRPRAPRSPSSSTRCWACR